MNCHRAIEAALREVHLPVTIVQRKSFGGGHGASVELVTLDNGEKVVSKCAQPARCDALHAEAIGLDALAHSETVRVPRVLHFANTTDGAALLTTFIDPGRATEQSWKQFGGELAALHAAPPHGDRYGFQIDNFLGATPQPNGWMDDWVEFNRVHRLQHQIEMARDGGLRTNEITRIEALCEKLDQYIPKHPKPALLHGDLWSGNALPTADGRIAVIDPAVYIGDGLADIAMMRLFGGFAQSCFDAYFQNVTDRENLHERITVYQLYHVLNHVNLFGRGYVGQALQLLSSLGF